MGKFAESAAQHDGATRGDGYCVAGRWIVNNLDEDDLVEFIRLANAHRWKLILRLSDNQLSHHSMVGHVHGLCHCFADRPAKGCCSCERKDS